MPKFDWEKAITGFGAMGLPGGIWGGLSGDKKPKKLSTLDKQQKGLYNEYMKGLMGQGGQFGDTFGWDPDQLQDVFNQNFAQPAYQQFQEEMVPGITGAFRGQNLQNSSYLGGALSKAGTDVQNNLNAQLAKMMYDAQQNSVDRRMDAVNKILNMQTFAYQKPQPRAFDQFMSGMANSGQDPTQGFNQLAQMFMQMIGG
jgi:hypothetical protein